jgi:hypothetical protein
LDIFDFYFMTSRFSWASSKEKRVSRHPRLNTANALAAVLVSGCTLLPGSIRDVSFKDVGPPDRNEVLHSWLVERYVSKYPDVLRLRFTSSEVLTSHTRDTAGFYATISLCPYDPEKHIWVSPVLYQGRDVADFRRGGPQPSPQPADGKYVYEAFFRYADQAQFNPKTHGMDLYPLPSKPMDICFRLEGPRMWFGVLSNVSIVPAEALANALNELKSR